MEPNRYIAQCKSFDYYHHYHLTMNSQNYMLKKVTSVALRTYYVFRVEDGVIERYWTFDYYIPFFYLHLLILMMVAFYLAFKVDSWLLHYLSLVRCIILGFNYIQ